MSKQSQWLTVQDLIELLLTMPQDAKIVVDNCDIFEPGFYYATRDSIESFTSDGEDQVIIGTNHNTRSL